MDTLPNNTQEKQFAMFATDVELKGIKLQTVEQSPNSQLTARSKEEMLHM